MRWQDVDWHDAEATSTLLNAELGQSQDSHTTRRERPQ